MKKNGENASAATAADTPGGLFSRAASVIHRRDSAYDAPHMSFSKYAVGATDDALHDTAAEGKDSISDGSDGSSGGGFVRPTGVTRGGTIDRLLRDFPGQSGLRRPRIKRRALEKSNDEVIRTLSKFSSTGKKLARRHQHRTLDASERHELHLMELKAFKNADEERHLHHEQPHWKISCMLVLESHTWELAMVLLTIFALYGSDLNDYFGSAQGDSTMDVFISITMGIFVVELILLSLVKKGYFLSLNFFLELVAAVSMLFDLKSLSLTEQLAGTGTAARAGRAARAGSRAGRLTRMIRVLRLTRIISLVLAFKRIQDTRMSHSRRQTEVDIFGTEEEVADFARQRKLSSSSSFEMENGWSGDKGEASVHPEDEAGSMSRRSYQRTTIDVILAMLVMLIGIMTLQYEPVCLSPEYEGLVQIDSVAAKSTTFSKDQNNSNSSDFAAAAAMIQIQLTSGFLDDFRSSCIYLDIRGTRIIDKDNATIGTLRGQELLLVDVYGDDVGEGGDSINYRSGPTSSAIFNRRPEFQAQAAASLLVTTVIITIILLVIAKIKSNADALTISVNNPLLKLCDDMVLVSDMHLEGPIVHLPSKVNEIRNAQLAFLKMKHALASFAKYVPYEVVREMINRGDGAVLGVHSKEITIFFSDIAGFTSICEALEPEDLLLLMSEYFDAMQTLIASKDSNGTLLEFIGDALLVVWNAPQDGE